MSSARTTPAKKPLAVHAAPAHAHAPAGPVRTMPEALAALAQRVDLERARPTQDVKDQYKLDRMRALLQVLSNPHEALRSVHVAGTKGKGSVCEMVASCLESCGYTVGLFTSPHLVDLRERIRINRAMISEDAFIDAADRVLQAAAPIEAGMGPCTYFELLTAMGFVHFADQAVDAAVIEVGLGGLLDCTNVITPEVAAVTTIGHDHTQILGSTLALIAEQKAGIFKPGVPALVLKQPTPDLTNIFRERAQRVGSPVRVVGEDVEFSHRYEFPPGAEPVLRVNLTLESGEHEHVACPLRGEHQAGNTALALTIVDTLAHRGFDCPSDKVLAGLARVQLPGRFEVINSSPRVLLDVAHNPESVRALMKSIGQYLQYDAMLVIFGCAADKDIAPMLSALSMAADKVVFTAASGNARAAKPEELQRRYLELSDKPSQIAPDFHRALEIARPSVNRGDLVVITGSFYLVGEAKKLLAAKAAAAKK